MVSTLYELVDVQRTIFHRVHHRVLDGEVDVFVPVVIAELVQHLVHGLGEAGDGLVFSRSRLALGIEAKQGSRSHRKHQRKHPESTTHERGSFYALDGNAAHMKLLCRCESSY